MLTDKDVLAKLERIKREAKIHGSVNGNNVLWLIRREAKLRKQLEQLQKDHNEPSKG